MDKKPRVFLTIAPFRIKKVTCSLLDIGEESKKQNHISRISNVRSDTFQCLHKRALVAICLVES